MDTNLEPLHAMFCSDCGTELREEASFCWKCVRRMDRGEMPVAQHEPQWETCEIEFERKLSP